LLALWQSPTTRILRACGQFDRAGGSLWQAAIAPVAAATWLWRHHLMTQAIRHSGIKKGRPVARPA